MAQWRKLIVSGSDAELNTLDLSTGLSVGTGNQFISSSTAIITGSFSGSFFGDFTGPSTVGLNISGSTGTDSLTIPTDTLIFDGGTSVTTPVTDNRVTINVGDATTAVKGIASFNSSFFSVTSGDVSIANASITETQLNTSVAGTGLSGGGGSALSVDYGSTGGTAVEGSTTLTVQGTANEVDVTGGSVTLGSGGTVTIGLPDNVTITSDLTVGGNLFVNGTVTTINTDNLLVEDRFILLASGSVSVGDGGLIIDDGAGSGPALFYDSTDTRWSLNASVSSGDTTAAPEAHVAAVVDASDPTQAAASGSYQHVGNIKVENEEVFIWF